MAAASASGSTTASRATAAAPLGIRQALVAYDASRRRLVHRAQLGRHQCRAAADAHRETAGAENLLGERPAHAVRGRHDRPEADRTAPQRQRDEHEQHCDDRSTVLPHELEQRAHVFFRHEHEVIAGAQVRCGREHLAVLALEDFAVNERHAVQHRDAAQTDGHARGDEKSLVRREPTARFYSSAASSSGRTCKPRS